MAEDYFWLLINILALFDVVVLGFVLHMVAQIAKRYSAKYGIKADYRALYYAFGVYVLYKLFWAVAVFYKDYVSAIAIGFLPNLLLLASAFIIRMTIRGIHNSIEAKLA